MTISTTISIGNQNTQKPSACMTKAADEEMSEMNEITYRKAHWEGKGGIACCLNIPKEFAGRMGLDKQSYLKVTYSDNKLIVEKLVDGGIIGNK